MYAHKTCGFSSNKYEFSDRSAYEIAASSKPSPYSLIASPFLTGRKI
jgi:hypothetical protein